MLKTIFAILFISLTSHPTGKNYENYCNTRFDFCIEYPGQFKAEPPPENGDGLTFISPDKKTKIITFGSLAIEDLDKLVQEYKIATGNISVTYHLQHKDWFIFSGTTKDKDVIYRKTRKTKINYQGQPDTYVFQTLMIKYPVSQSAAYASYCQTIAQSLR